MSIFVGFTVLAPLSNQKRYELVMNEILLYLKTHEHELKVALHASRFLSFEPLYGSGAQLTLPLSVLHLRTSYFRVFHQTRTSVPEDVKAFAGVAWEVLQILRQNFPSKIQLYQQHLDLCCPNYKPLSVQEECRRQVSCLISKLEEAKMLLKEEIQDICSTISSCVRLGDLRSVSICLELLNSSFHCPDALLTVAADVHSLTRAENLAEGSEPSELKQKVLDLCSQIHSKLNKVQHNIHQPLQMKHEGSLMQEPSHHYMIGGILDEFEDQKQPPSRLKVGTERQTRRDTRREPLQEQCVNLPLGPSLSLTETQYSTSKFGKPSSLRVAMFQMIESSDPQRVAFVIENIVSSSDDKFMRVLEKYSLKDNIVKVLQKYCDGAYGFEGEVVRSGYLQIQIMNTFIRMSRARPHFQELIDATSSLELVTQLMEEAVIFVYEDAIAGVQSGEHKCMYFLQNALAWFQLALHIHFARWFDQFKAHLATLERRLHRLTDQEYQFTRTLTAKFTGLLRKEAEGESEELKMVCPALSDYLRQVQATRYKFDALGQLNENFSEKFERLFMRDVI